MEQQHKTCTGCGETKPLDGFSRAKSSKYGVQSYCKPCMAEYHRRYYKENREKLNESSRKYYESNREKVMERTQRYYEENRDKALDSSRRYRKRNREIHNAKSLKNEREKSELTKMLSTVPPFTRWTPGEDAFILADNGMTMYQKAIELGRTYGSVKYRWQRLLAKGGVSNDRANA